MKVWIVIQVWFFRTSDMEEIYYCQNNFFVLAYYLLLCINFWIFWFSFCLFSCTQIHTPLAVPSTIKGSPKKLSQNLALQFSKLVKKIVLLKQVHVSKATSIPPSFALYLTNIISQENFLETYSKCHVDSVLNVKLFF